MIYGFSLYAHIRVFGPDMRVFPPLGMPDMLLNTIFSKILTYELFTVQKRRKSPKKAKKNLDFFRLFFEVARLWTNFFGLLLADMDSTIEGRYVRHTWEIIWAFETRSIWPTMGEIQCKNHNFWKTKLWSSISPLPRSAQRKYFACKLDLCMATWSQKISTLSRRTKMVL